MVRHGEGSLRGEVFSARLSSSVARMMGVVFRPHCLSLPWCWVSALDSLTHPSSIGGLAVLRRVFSFVFLFEKLDQNTEIHKAV